MKCEKYKKYPLWKCGGEKELISGWALSARCGNYTALSSASNQTHCALVICDRIADSSFAQHALKITTTQAGHLQHSLVVTWLAPCQTAVILVHILCTPYNHAPDYSDYLKPPTLGLAVTRYLPFWQNGQHLLHATAVTGEWNWYWNKSQYRKLTLEKKILALLLPGLKQKTFQFDILPQSYPCSPVHASGCVCMSVCMCSGVMCAHHSKCLPISVYMLVTYTCNKCITCTVHTNAWSVSMGRNIPQTHWLHEGKKRPFDFLEVKFQSVST